MYFDMRVDFETAIRIAELLEGDGSINAAAAIWQGLIATNPYERRPRERFADLTCQTHKFSEPSADVTRLRQILKCMKNTFPTPRLTRAYFDNLGEVLRPLPKRTEPGRIVLGVGTGRCGTTTLTGMMAGVSGACSTHENPPWIDWEPLAEQLEVHVERFRVLRQYFAVVFDAASWWLNSLDHVFQEFPNVKVIGLYRETQSCVQSFLNSKGTGKGSVNHWALPANGIWIATPGDPSYPSYPVPASLASDCDAARRAMVTRYVTEYNETLFQMAAANPHRILLVRTEDLSSPATAARMSEFLGFEVPAPSVSLNVGPSQDSSRPEMTF